MASWQVHAHGERVSLIVNDGGIRLGGAQPQEWAWTEITSVEFPNAFSARVTALGSDPIQVGFTGRSEQREFAQSYAQIAANPQGPGAHLPSPPVPAGPAGTVALLTISEAPGRVIAQSLGLATAHCVMNRGMFSDAGSDLMSIFGGKLAGMEKAIAQAVADARSKLERSARELGADAVVGVSIDIAAVADKAEAVLAAGTAVRTVSSPPA